MYDRINTFITKNNILYKYQFGFREAHGTNMALIVLMDKILFFIDPGDLDFSKAFDTFDHKILLEKLYKYGIRGLSYEWIKDYLHNRQQYVTLRTVHSSHQYRTCEVAQGSILGPLLFILYINDIATVSSILLPILYADDTNLFLNGEDINELIIMMNKELQNIVEWLNVNKLSLSMLRCDPIYGILF